MTYFLENDVYTRNLICPKCKSEFSTAGFDMKEYSYKIDGKPYCSYNCYNSELKRKEDIIRKKQEKYELERLKFKKIKSNKSINLFDFQKNK